MLAMGASPRFMRFHDCSPPYSNTLPFYPIMRYTMGYEFPQRAENAAVIGHLDTLAGTGGASAPTISSHKALNEALFKGLNRKYYNNAKIYTNQSGFLFLANLDDGNNRPLFVPDVTQPDKYMYRGKEIVVIEDSLLENIDTGSGASAKSYAPFFIGNLAEYVWMFERQGMELAISTESLPSRGAWIEIADAGDIATGNSGRSLHGERGLK